MSWKILKSEEIIKNKFFSIHKDQCEKTDGKIIEDYYTANRPDVAMIIAFTPEMALVMIHQYRHPVHSADYEIPAGFIEPYEKNIIEAAKRELLEETGYETDQLIQIQDTYSSAGFMSNHVFFFIGFNAKKIAEQNLDENEELETHVLPWNTALELLKTEKIKDLGSVTGVLLAKKYLEEHGISTTISSTPSIYLDHAATTPVDPEVLKAMLPYFSEEYGNAESLHTKGQNARIAVDNSRETIAKILKCSDSEIIFTSGGTESNNLAIFGTVQANSKKGRHLITSSIEHSSVRGPFTKLEEEGYEVTWLKVDKGGLIDPAEVAASIRPDTILVSIMYANNEIGTIEPIAEIGKICRDKGVIFHTDACQALDSCNLDVEKLNTDLLTLNASKIYGPKGAGALYVKRGTAIKPLTLGSSAENGLRAGTHNVPGIVGLAKALELATENQTQKNSKLINLRNTLIKGILEKVPGANLNGPNPFHCTCPSPCSCPRLPNNTNFTFPGIEGQDLLLQLDNVGIYISTGAACTVRTAHPSNVLRALGISTELIQSSVRLTLGKNTSEKDIECVLEVLPDLILKMRKRG